MRGCCCVRRRWRSRRWTGRVQRSDQEFYGGKVAAAQWFCRQVLPQVAAERAVLEATDHDVMELDDSAF